MQTQVMQQSNCTERIQVDATTMRSSRNLYFHVSSHRRIHACWPGSGRALAMHAKVARCDTGELIIVRVENVGSA